MLPKDSIARVHQYYAEDPKHRDDFSRAVREFFDKPNLKKGDKLETNEYSEGLFNEWFFYDFILANGRTVLQDFIIENPFGLDFVSLQLYRDLLEHAHYGIFAVKRVAIGKGMVLEDVCTGQTWDVQEVKATYQAREGDAFFNRVGKVGDHFELIGANSFSFGQINEDAKKYLRSSPVAWTPKEAHAFLQQQR